MTSGPAGTGPGGLRRGDSGEEAACLPLGVTVQGAGGWARPPPVGCPPPCRRAGPEPATSLLSPFPGNPAWQACPAPAASGPRGPSRGLHLPACRGWAGPGVPQPQRRKRHVGTEAVLRGPQLSGSGRGGPPAWGKGPEWTWGSGCRCAATTWGSRGRQQPRAVFPEDFDTFATGKQDALHLPASRVSTAGGTRVVPAPPAPSGPRELETSLRVPHVPPPPTPSTSQGRLSRASTACPGPAGPRPPPPAPLLQPPAPPPLRVCLEQGGRREGRTMITVTIGTALTHRQGSEHTEYLLCSHLINAAVL